MIAVAILITQLFSCSCKDGKKIAEKTDEKNTIAASISTKQDEVISCKKCVDSLTRERDNQYTYSNTIKDSADHVIRESPIATAYINEFDKEPIDILQEYIKKATEEERDNLLKAHIILIGYGAFDSNQVTIKLVRSQLQHFDEQKKTCMNKIEEFNREIEKRQSAVTILKEEISNLITRAEAIDRELEVLNS